MTETPQIELQKLLDTHKEWLLTRVSGKSFPIQNSEIELETINRKFLINFFDDNGLQTWRIKAYKIENEKITLELTRNFARENEKINLAPRISVNELNASVELARIEKANRIAALIIANDPRRKIIQIRLNEENGRFAQIIFTTSSKTRIAAIADVSDKLTPEILLSAAIFRLIKLQNNRKNPVSKIWIIADKKRANDLQKILALLRESWKSEIEIYEISLQNKTAQNQENFAESKSLIKKPNLSVNDLWREKAGAITPPKNSQISETAQSIVAVAPAEIDVIASRNGETLRFFGLPFARVRRVFDREKIWFGTERSLTLLTENNIGEFAELIENLQTYRRFDSPNPRHEFYRRAPEAWLESLFRKNIKLLDANLVLSPIFQQFRAGREQIDLLALRRDGRLVIIELKVAPDREMVFQAIDYWRKIELQRRKGNLDKIKLFGNLQISAQPAVVYLVAPTLAFHRDFDFLSRTVAGEIEIHRFNLAENWRETLKILNRQ